MGLTDVLEDLGAADGFIAQKVQELQKEASEDKIAGRIAARGFYDELQKIAAPAPGAEHIKFGPNEGLNVRGNTAAHRTSGGEMAPGLRPTTPPPFQPKGGAMGAISKATAPGTAFSRASAPNPKPGS